MARVGINAVLLTEQSGGLGDYILRLIEGMLELGHQHELVVFISEQKQAFLHSKIPNVPSIPLRLPVENPIARTVMEPWVWPRIIRSSGIDLFHSTNSYIPLGVRVPSVVTIHDLRYWHSPETYSKLRGKYLEIMISRALRFSKKIIAISEFTKKDILNHFPISQEKITVIHHGLNKSRFTAPFSDAECAAILDQYAIPKPYILTVGHLEPRKNYPRLLEAYKHILEQQNIPHNLVIVGRENWYYAEIYRKVRELSLEKRVVFTGFVKDEHMPLLYQQADLFVAPSFFEGFGFTPLESLAAGTPVVASHYSSHPEILADAALYFDPFDVADMAEKMALLILNPSITEQLLQHSQHNLARFNWQKCCQNTWETYQKVMAL